MPRGNATPRHGAEPIRVGGLAAMRALAHPTRVRMMHLLRTEPLSASELARRLQIRFGSAQYHLQALERAGIARKVAERSKRGGTEVLHQVPGSLWVDPDQDTPRGMRQAINRAYLAEISRRLDAAAAEPQPEDTDRDVFSTYELEFRPQDIPTALEAFRAFHDRLQQLALDAPTKDSLPVTVSVLLFRIPRSASQHPDAPGGPA
jgi:DNA-binding transcriptional ArsR family regulator